MTAGIEAGQESTTVAPPSVAVTKQKRLRRRSVDFLHNSAIRIRIRIGIAAATASDSQLRLLELNLDEMCFDMMRPCLE